MSLGKTLLFLSVPALLAPGAGAAAELSAPGGAVPAYFAREIVASVAAPRTLTTSASADTRLNWSLGYNFSSGEVRHARVECSDTLRFDPATTVASSDPGAASIGAINHHGGNVITFSLTSSNAGSLITAGDVLTLSGDHAITGTDAPVDCAVGLYDQPSQAQTGGPTGLVSGSAFAGTYLAFVPSFGVSVVPTIHVADVEANPAFGSFVAPNLGHAELGRSGVTGSLAYGLRDPDGSGPQNAPFNVEGVEIGLAELLDDDTVLVAGGDFSLAASAGDTPFDLDARARTWLRRGPWATALPASALATDTVVWPVGNTPFADGYVELHRRSGNVIHVSDYTLSLRVVAADPAKYRVHGIDRVALGEIVRNGTELQAPLAQVPGGWISRLVLTNTGNADRAYRIKVLSETGNVVGTDNLTGTVPANGTRVIEDLGKVLTGFSGPNRRATLVVAVSGPNGQIQGLYQIVNPDQGSISNHVLVRPGTN